ncbi:MAG: hypothetical protein HQ546_05250 [Planctomycetes bacterium]|nr:hypothetical protein [Planctomycetota bacterium]
MSEVSQDSNAASCPPANDSPRGLEPWFVCTVCALLLTIIAALTGLSLRFHRQTRLAEARLSEVLTELGKKETAVQVLGEGAARLLPRLATDKLPRTEGTLDGQTVTILHLSNVMGRAIGLQSGDLLRVLPSTPTTVPATWPGVSQP